MAKVFSIISAFFGKTFKNVWWIEKDGVPLPQLIIKYERI
jgi:hypothetical protein